MPSLVEPTKLSFGRAQFLLHLTVLVWGLTAILGKLITLPALCLVFYRQIFAGLGILLIAGWSQVRVEGSKMLPLMVGGLIIAIHWSLFFGSVHLNGIAISVICLSVGSFFTSLIEPWMLNKRWDPWDSSGGLFAVLGVVWLVSGTAEQQGSAPITAGHLAVGLGAALFGGVFSAFNGRYISHYSDYQISFWQLIWGACSIGIVLLACPEQWRSPLEFGLLNWLSLLVLSVVCTTLPWIWTARVLRVLSPFTVQLAVNLEPVYSMVIAYWCFPKTERLAPSFYGGALALLTVIGIHQYWARRRLGRV